MRHHDIHLTGIGSALGELVPVDRLGGHGRRAVSDQLSVSVATGCTGPDLAVLAAGRALTAADEHRARGDRDGGRIVADVHLHTAIWAAGKGLDFWSSATGIANRLGLQPAAGLSLEINAMSNSITAGLELAATLLAGHPDWRTALLTGGETFGGTLARIGADVDIAYGDGGSAAVLSRHRGHAALLATASFTDPALESLHRGDDPVLPADRYGSRTIDLLARKNAHLATTSVTAVRDRIATGMVEATKTALGDAGIALDDVDRVLAPHYGSRTVRTNCLRPLGLGIDRAAHHLATRWGHLGPHDQLAALDHLLRTGELRPGQTVLLLGAGVGMTWTSAVLRITDTPTPGAAMSL